MGLQRAKVKNGLEKFILRWFIGASPVEIFSPAR